MQYPVETKGVSNIYLTSPHRFHSIASSKTPQPTILYSITSLYPLQPKMKISALFIFTSLLLSFSVYSFQFSAPIYLRFSKNECSICTENSECSTGICSGNPPRCVRNTYESMLDCGFTKECGKCESSQTCATGHCIGGKCVFLTKASSKRCSQKRECSSCYLDKQCETGVCWGNPARCVHETYESKVKCGFTPECGKCTSSSMCSTGKCVKGQCVYDTETSMRKCFKRLPECSPCSHYSDCATGKCLGQPRRCVYETYQSKVKCGFGAECESCKSEGQCATGHCIYGYCVFDMDESQHKCFPKYS